MQDVYKNIDRYNPRKKHKVLIFFDKMIAHMISNKKIAPAVTKLFTKGRELNVSLASIVQSCIKVPKDIRLNSTLYFIMKNTYSIKKSFNKLQSNIHQMLTFKILFNFIKNVLQNHILFWSKMQLYHQTILYVLKEIFRNVYK